MRGMAYAAAEILLFMVVATAIGYYLARLHMGLRGTRWQGRVRTESERRSQAENEMGVVRDRVKDLELRLSVATQAIRELEDTNSALRKAVSVREDRLHQLEEKRRRRHDYQQSRRQGAEITLRTGVGNPADAIVIFDVGERAGEELGEEVVH